MSTVKADPRTSWSCEALLGPTLQEDRIGLVEITFELDAFQRAIIRTATDFQPLPLDQQQAWRKVALDRVLSVRETLQPALAHWLTQFVLFDDYFRQASLEEFLVRLPLFDVEILALPSVQDKIRQARAQLRAAQKAAIGRWLQGTSKRGRPRGGVDKQQIRALFKNTRQDVRVVMKLVCDGTAWETIRTRKPMTVSDIERLDLKDKLFAEQYDLERVDRFASSLVAAMVNKTGHENIAASTVLRYARTKVK